MLFGRFVPVLAGTVRVLVTGLVLGVAVLLASRYWHLSLETGWTRDGRVRAETVIASTDTGGIVSSVVVHDNQRVERGDVLLTFDSDRALAALKSAEAVLAARRTSFQLKRAAAEAAPSDASLGAAAAIANYEMQEAMAARDLAALTFSHMAVKAPVSGYVTNLLIHPGEYAAIGAPLVAVIDADSYYVSGYFEETKLPLLQAGARVDIQLLAGGPKLGGVIDGWSRGVADRDMPASRGQLAEVNPSFNWVRLAQRVPVRIRLDPLPAGVELVAGTTCTVSLHAPGS